MNTIATTLLSATILLSSGLALGVVVEPAPGLYDEAVVIRVVSDADEVRYTIDGSPVTGHSAVWMGDLSATEPVALRLRGYTDGIEAGPEFIGSYVVGIGTDLAVFALIVDPFDLDDEGTGILANGTQRGREWERPAHLTFVPRDRSDTVEIPAGLRMHGRYGSIQKPSFRLYFRSEYGAGKFHQKIYESSHVREWDNVLLRSGSQDAIFGWTLLRNKLMYELFLEYGQPAPASDFSIFLLNGRLMGVYNHMEYVDDRFLENHLDIPREEADLIRIEWYANAREGNTQAYEEFFGFFHSNPAISSDVFDVYTERMDIGNFMLYQIFNVTMGNADWPQNNWDMARRRHPAGIWRWIMYDVDMSQGMVAGTDAPTVEWAFRDRLREDMAFDNEVQLLSTLLVRQLLANESFRADFLQSWAHLLGTVFTGDSMGGRIEGLRLYIADSIIHEEAAWSETILAHTVADWTRNVNFLRDFWEARGDSVRLQLQSFFGLDAPVGVELHAPPIHEGILRVQGFGVQPATSFAVEYFADLPLRLEVIPSPGYRLLSWGIDGAEGTTVVVYPEAAMHIAPMLERDIDFDWSAAGLPTPHHLLSRDYRFDYFCPQTPAGSYPPSMIFLQTDTPDPGIDEDTGDLYIMVYDLESRSRVVALEDDGLGFVNTGNPQPDGGGYVTGAVLSLGTVGLESAWLSFIAGTVAPNSRPYALRLQGRPGPLSSWEDIHDADGEVVEYAVHSEAGHYEHFGGIPLPSELMGVPSAQLRWRYYAMPTGVSGPRAFLRVGSIAVEVERPREMWILF